jgi:membrane protein YdbS with pleckstrin-like domain
MIPAYGKDLQDALSRVVREKKIRKVEQTTEKVPMAVWLLLWFMYMGILIIGYYETTNHWIFFGGIIGIVAVVLSLNWWGRPRNESKVIRK